MNGFRLDLGCTAAGDALATIGTRLITISEEGVVSMKKIVVRKAGTVRLTSAAAFYDDPSCPIIWA
jgi:hypothetical protein